MLSAGIFAKGLVVRHRKKPLSAISATAAPVNAGALRELLAQSIVELRNGTLDPKVANSISYLGVGFLRALEMSALEDRVASLEARAKDDEKKA